MAVRIVLRPSGSPFIREMSKSAYKDIARERGMGVALMTNMCGLLAFCNNAARC